MTFLRTLAAKIKTTWTNGPVPCWTEYLHQTQGARQ